ncbi:MAG: Release factor glutamine methyltransferase [Parabacteroides sp.]
MTETIAYIKTSLLDLYPQPEIDGLVRLILERICHIQPYHMLLDKDRTIPEEEKKRIKDIVEHLKKMEPIQYILGIADFYDMEFEVNPSVLIPRPETAELVELIIKENKGQKINLLDIGTGSGCIAIALASGLKDPMITAVDISDTALEIAHRNAIRNHAHVKFIQTDILSTEKAQQDIPGKFGIIVSNPPYIKNEEKKDMEKNVLDYEPHLALFVPDNDPLLFYRRIARFGKEKLEKNGFLYFEINSQYGPETVDMLQKEGYKNIELRKDFYSRDRIIKAQK